MYAGCMLTFCTESNAHVHLWGGIQALMFEGVCMGSV